MPKHKIITGADNFKKLITEGDVFVDKTLFIKEVLESGRKAILITRPRSWGKSLALDMLKTFLAMEVDENGQEIKENSNKILFTGGKYTYLDGRSKKIKILSKSKIAESKNKDGEFLIEMYQGAYPVIHIIFREPSDYNFVTFDDIKNDIISQIKRAYEDHKYLSKSEKLNTEQKRKFSNCMNGLFENPQSLPEENVDKVLLRDSLKFLTELLHQHYNQKAYVLVDEADKPVSCFLESGLEYELDDRNKVIKLVSSILETCSKGNDKIEKVILTGIFDIFFRGANSGFNNLEVYGIGDAMFAKHFGFTEKEITEQLLSKLQKETTKEDDDAVNADLALTENVQNSIMKNIKEWYSGYRLPLSEYTYIEVYPPWAVMLYIADLNEDSTKLPKEYWDKSGVNLVLDKLVIPELGITDQASIQDASSVTTTTVDTTAQTKMILSPPPEAKRSRSHDRDDIHRAIQTLPRSENTEGLVPLAVSITKPHDVDASKSSGNQLILSHQKSYDVAEYYVTYYGAGINELLHLRIKDSELRDVAILKASFLYEATMPYLLDATFTQIQDGFSKVVLPLNIDGKHWVGLVIEKQDNHLDIKYLDSENREMPLKAQVALSVVCAQKRYQVTFSAVMVKEQRYSNCGPELIENFIMLLTGTRATQEASVPLHSLLYANSVLDSDGSALQIAENSRMIELLTNRNIPLYRMSILEPKISAVIIYYGSKLQEHNVAVASFSLLQSLQKTFEHVNTKLDLCFKYINNIFGSNSYVELQSLANKYEVDIKIVDANSAKSAYKKIAIKTHPDKVEGNVEDFRLAQTLSEQNVEVSINYNQIMSNLDKGHAAFRVVRTLIDLIKLSNDDVEQVNVLNIFTNCGYLFESLTSTSIGMKYFSGLSIGYQLYEMDYNGALTSISTLAIYTLPVLLMPAAPALAVTIKAGFVAYDIYYAVTDLYYLLGEIDLISFSRFDYTFQL